MKADNVALLEFIGASKRTFYIPVYQRNYDWKKMQCATLFKDIEDIAVSTKRNSHFMGTVVYPFLLSVFEDCYIYKNIDKIQVCNTMDVILSYVARRLLCEMPTNALNKVFATMAKDVERYADMQLHEKVILVLAGKKGKVAFPNDNILKEHMISRDVYKFPHIKFVLEQIEKKKSKETVASEGLTIEHIMPQILSAKWKIDLGKRSQEVYDKYLHCLGNLTLSGYNSELSNATISL